MSVARVTRGFDAIRDDVATKQDLDRTAAALKADIAAVRLELKADIAAVRLEFKADIPAVEHRLVTRLGGLVVVVAGLLFAALHHWPPHG